jgi:hypothetical protein
LLALIEAYVFWRPQLPVAPSTLLALPLIGVLWELRPADLHQHLLGSPGPGCW